MLKKTEKGDYEMNMIKTGRLICERRIALGMTQTELARRLDVTDKAVSKWERGKSLPDITLLGRLAVELKISVIEILSGAVSNVTRSSNIDETISSPTAEDYARRVTLELDAAGDILVSPYLFGTNLEHTRSCIHTGLSAQMLRNRKFAGKPSACRGCAAEWYPIGEKTVFAMNSNYAYTRHAEGYHMNRSLEMNAPYIMNPCAGHEAGIGQHDLCVLAEKVYQTAVVVKTKTPVTISLALTNRSGSIVYGCQKVLVDAPDWKRFEVKLEPGVSDSNADLRITFSEPGSVCIGAVSMMPNDHFRGMRRDVIDRLRELGVTVLRWPGGNFAGEYNWMDGLLPVDMRAPFESCLGLETQPHSMGYDYHEINTDDFIALCREVGAEPFITINPCWNTPQENAAWVEYCNGDASTQYGRLRMERGFEEPYNVQLWSLGNEFGYGHMEGDNSPSGYCRIAMENGGKMLEVTPHLSLCSSGPYPNKQWAELSARPLSDIAQLVSLHYYGHNPAYTDQSMIESEYYACLASVFRMRSLARELRGMLDNNIKISFDEWNIWYAWYRPSNVTDGIYAALALHMLMGEAEKSGIALACHFEAVNEGMITVGPDSTALTAQGQVFSLMKSHAGGILCHTSIDAVATIGADGCVTATVVNASLDADKEVCFSGCGECIEAICYTSDTVLPPSVFKTKDVLRDAHNGQLRMPPHSLMLLRFRCG